MPEVIIANPAEQAAQSALERMHNCIDQGNSFLVEAGAGAGKTHSLINALKYMIDRDGMMLLRHRQQIACLTYTNTACDEIKSRIDHHPAVLTSTIHAFCWSLIKGFQPILREMLYQLPSWADRLAELAEIGTRTIEYDLGHRQVEEHAISIHHNDVLSLAVNLMDYAKFRSLLVAQYPVLFIDEYQDTNAAFVDAIKAYFLETERRPLIGFFGDHWQMIYDGCGKIEHRNLVLIGKQANFRSVKPVVDVLNCIRPELKQHVKDPRSQGEVAVYHTNKWSGTRRTGSHWSQDLPQEEAHAHLETLKKQLTAQGWDFSAETTKVLMLTHNVLAHEQGYEGIAQVFTNTDDYIKKKDPYVAFFLDVLEPVCLAYGHKQFGEMFTVAGGRTPTIKSHADKLGWRRDMDALLRLRATGTIGSVVDYLMRTKRPRLSDAIERREEMLAGWEEGVDDDETSALNRLRQLRGVQYAQVIRLAEFVEGNTPFATKHSVKGAEFENVLVVIGRGWSQYNFNQYLEWAGTAVPANKQLTYERNRNLFYVCCSRPVKRLALLFTQQLSDQAIATLSAWFGGDNVHSL